MKVTLAHVAARAGVSQATVSRVLNSKPGVAATTRTAVLSALDEHGYEGSARPVRRTAGLVGLVLPELDNPIFPAFASAVAAGLAQHGYTPVLCTQSFGGVHEDDYVRMLLDRQVAGIVFISGLHANVDADPARYRALVERGLPIVLVNGDLPGVAAPSVSNDDTASVELAVGHLAQLGHRRIGLAIGPRRYVPVIRKLAAFPKAMARHLPGALVAREGPERCRAGRQSDPTSGQVAASQTVTSVGSRPAASSGPLSSSTAASPGREIGASPKLVITNTSRPAAPRTRKASIASSSSCHPVISPPPSPSSVRRHRARR